MRTTNVNRGWTWLAGVIVTSWIVGHGSAAQNSAPATKKDVAPLPIVLPAATDKGTPADLPSGPMIEPPPDRDKPKPRPPFFAPAGVKNVALGKKVTASTDKVFTGKLEQITDGKKEPSDDHAVEMRKGTQWVQVDLEKEYTIYAILLWHDHRWLQLFYDVVVKASNDPEFKNNVRTLFNNDVDDTSKQGIGTDKEYFETEEGKLIDAKGVKARYLRFYSNGNSQSAWNNYQEIEVYALPAK